MLQYMKGTINMGIQYQCHDDGHILNGFLDANWASNNFFEDPPSTTIFCL
jgi:hypothetical protein